MSTLFNEDFIVKHGLVVNTTATFLSTATSVSSTTGALIVSGGIGVSGTANFGGTVRVQNVDLLAYDPDAIYVSESTGNDVTGDGRRIQSAFKTVKKALTVATTGTIVNIDAGVYYEEWPLSLPKGVTIKGVGLRATEIRPTTATNTATCFLLDGECTVEDVTISNFFKPGYAFKFKTGAKITTRSPYIQRVTVLTRGSVTSPTDPYGFDSADAGGGAYLDAAVIDKTSLEPAMLWNEVTMIVPNATGWYMTNGARAELLNGFSYFAEKSIHTVSTPVGYGGDGKTKLRLDGITGVFTPGDTLYYKDDEGNTLASGVIESTSTGGYVYIDGAAWGFEEITARDGKSITPYGGAIQSTAKKKFGTSSYLGNGISSYLQHPSTTDFAFGTGTFTLECFVNRNTTTGEQGIFDLRLSAGSTAPYVYFSGTNAVYQVGSTATITATGSVGTTSTWFHLAVARSGTETKMFIDGTQVGSTYIDTWNLVQGPIVIGARFDGTQNFDGYLDEIRVSKGIARYTSNFVAPTAPFVSDSNTKLLLHCDGGNLSSVFIDDALGSQNVYSVGSAYTGTAARIILADYHQFGAELRCIGSAAVFGTYGVIADGTGTNLKLIAYNLSHIGSGKDFSDDISLVVQANEIVQTNGGTIYYQTVDQSGDFRVGDAFLINQRTGNVSFGEATLNIGSLPNLTITDGTDSVIINPDNIRVGQLNLSQNTISSVSGNIALSPANGQVIINSNLQVGTSITATNFYGTLFGSANNLSNGVLGVIPYQTAPNTTAFIGTGTNGSLLQMGANTATFVNSSSIQVGFAANILGGSAGRLVYQTADNATGFVNTATDGNVLVSKGVAAPEFVSTTTLYVGRALIADSATGGSNSAVNISGGTLGQIPYQTAPGATSFFGPGTQGQILVSGGTAVPVYTNTASIYVKDADIATNVRNGTAGQLVYQSAANTTGFSNVGSAGDLLISGGSAAPTFTGTTTIYVGRAVVADTALNTSGSSGSSDQIKTQIRTNNGTHYLTFVDANNPEPGIAKNLYTTSSFVINPATGNVGLGTASPLEKIHVAGNYILIDNNANADGGLIVDTGFNADQNSQLVLRGQNVDYWSLRKNSTNQFSIYNLVSNSSALTVSANNNIGIATSSPDAKLHVAGDARITGITTITNATSVHNATSGALQVAGGIGVSGGGFFGGIVTATTFIGAVSGTATIADNLSGGSGGSIPYQTAPNATTFVGIGANNSILVSNGTVPSWTTSPVIGGNLTIQGNLTVQGTTVVVDSTVTNVSDPIITIGTGPNNTPPVVDDGKDRGIAFWWNNGSNSRTGFFGFDRSTGYFTFLTSATITNEVVSPAGGTTRGALDVNLAGGIAGDFVYQSAPDTTAFISTGSIYVARAVLADTASATSGNAGSADQIKTQARTQQATHYVTFVNTNNLSATNEDLYTTATFTVDPATSNVGIGVESASADLHVRGESGELLRLDSSLTTTGAADTGPQLKFVGHDGSQSRDFVLLVAGKENSTVGNRATYFAIQTRPEGGNLTERVRVDSFGKVGLGTSVPTAQLEVVGGAIISGLTTVTNATSVYDATSGALQVAGGIGVAGGGFFGGTVTATNFVGAITGASTQVTTVQRPNAGTHFLAFVDSDNAAATAETVYTTATVTVNPGTPAATSTTTGALQIVNAGIGVGGSVYVQNRVGFVNASNVSAVYQVYNPGTNSLDTVFA